MMKKAQVGANFMDSIFNSLKELKHERSCLAQRLTEQQSQRHTLEQELDTLNSKYSQVETKLRRISDSFAVAQKKMDTCIVSSSRLQEEIDKHKVTKKSLEESCEIEKSSILERTNQFKSTLADIAKELYRARDSYKETALLNKISETENITQEKTLKVEQDDKQIQDLNRSIDNLTMEETVSCCDTDVEALINFTIRAFEVDKNESEAHLLQLQRELKGVHEALQSTEASG